MQAKEIQLKETARFFKVLADEARLKMLWLLFNNRELCVCDIMATLEITQSKAPGTLPLCVMPVWQRIERKDCGPTIRSAQPVTNLQRRT
jgi:hypothetical protein